MNVTTYKTIGRYAIATIGTVAAVALWNVRSPSATIPGARFVAVDEAEIRAMVLERNLVARPIGETAPRLTVATITNGGTVYTLTNSTGLFPSSWLAVDADGNAPHNLRDFVRQSFRDGSGIEIYNAWIEPPASGDDYSGQASVTYQDTAAWWYTNRIGTNAIYWYQFLTRTQQLGTVTYTNWSKQIAVVMVGGTNRVTWTNVPTEGTMQIVTNTAIVTNFAGGGLNAYIVNTNVLHNLAQLGSRMTNTWHGIGRSGSLPYEANIGSGGFYSRQGWYGLNESATIAIPTFSNPAPCVVRFKIFTNAHDFAESDADVWAAMLSAAPGYSWQTVNLPSTAWRLGPAYFGTATDYTWGLAWQVIASLNQTASFVCVGRNAPYFGNTTYAIYMAVEQPLTAIYHVNGDGMTPDGYGVNPLGIAGTMTPYTVVGLPHDNFYFAGANPGFADFGLGIATNHYNKGTPFAYATSYPCVTNWSDFASWTAPATAWRGGAGSQNLAIIQVDGFSVLTSWLHGAWNFQAGTNPAAFPPPAWF